jgi:hypothetical protein
MATLTATPAQDPLAASDELLTEDDQELIERLESLQVRLEPTVLAAVMALHDNGESTEQISAAVKLNPTVMGLEVRRELERHNETPTLTAEEWNGLAAGTHVPSKQLREMIDTAVRYRYGLSRTSILRDAGIKDSGHGHRLLGYKPYPGQTRPRQTIPCEYAAGIAHALNLAPVEVGL